MLAWHSSAQGWGKLHERAFRRLGGTPRVVVLDNLKEGVLTPDVYEPTLNPLYRDVLAHYGVTPLPCRVRNPNRKGKVEAGIGHTQKTPLRGLGFETLAQAQAYLDRWEAHWADTRIHGTTKRQVAVMFAEERPALQPLPVEPFRYYRYGVRTVHLNGCVEVDAAITRRPPAGSGRQSRCSGRTPCPAAGAGHRPAAAGTRPHQARVASHQRRRSSGPHARPTLALLARARYAGAHLHAVCTHIHTHRGPPASVASSRVLASPRNRRGRRGRRRQGRPRLHVPTYRFLRRYLERRPAARSR